MAKVLGQCSSASMWANSSFKLSITGKCKQLKLETL